MITITQAPALDTIIPDGNDNLLIVNTDAGADFYFKFEISVNDILFSERSIAKDSEGNAAFNFKGFYDDYFSLPDFAGAGLTSFPGLMAKINITVKELSVSDDSEADSVSLNTFYIIKGIEFTLLNTSVLNYLGLPATEILALENGLVNVPLSFPPGELSVSIYDNNSNLLDSQRVTTTEHTIGSYGIDLSTLTIPAFTPYLRVDIFLDGDTESKLGLDIVIIRDAIYPTTKIRYRNNNGILLQRYLTGKREEERNLSPKQYTQADRREVTYEISEIESIEIDTGYFHERNKEEILAIGKSLEVWLDVSKKGAEDQRRYTSETKKIRYYSGNEFLYNTVLKLNQQLN